jgi:hypothetical protein
MERNSGARHSTGGTGCWLLAKGDSIFDSLGLWVHIQAWTLQQTCWSWIREELRGIQIRTATIFISGPKPRVYEWLVVEPKNELRALAADHFERLGQPAPGVCSIAEPNGPYREWFAGWWNEGVSVRWLGYRPRLGEYVGRIAARYPDLTILPEAHPELDLVGIVSKREPERRRLLAKAKKIGFNNECVWALYMYTGYTLYQRRKSLKEAQEYMSTIDEEVDPPEQAAAPTTTLADPHR